MNTFDLSLRQFRDLGARCSDLGCDRPLRQTFDVTYYMYVTRSDCSNANRSTTVVSVTCPRI